MFGGKRRAPLKKVSAAVPLKRTFPSRRILEDLNRDQTVERGFSGQQPGFPPVFVVGGITQQPHAGRATDQGPDPGIGQGVEVADSFGIVGQTGTDVAISHKEPSGNSRERHQPLGVRGPNSGRTGPNMLLVQQEISSQADEALLQTWFRFWFAGTRNIFRLCAPLVLIFRWTPGVTGRLPVSRLWLLGTKIRF